MCIRPSEDMKYPWEKGTKNANSLALMLEHIWKRVGNSSYKCSWVSTEKDSTGLAEAESVS
jgi:hypothetical protein